MLCKNFNLIKGQVTDLGQVTWPNLKNTLRSCHSHSLLWICLPLSAFDEATVPYNSYISDFWVRDLRSGQSRDLPHWKSMGKYSNASYFENTHQITLIFSTSCYIELFLMTQVQLLFNDPPQGHLRSHGVTDGFLPITFDRVKIEKWKWHHCVCLVNTHRSIWNLTYLSDLDLDRDLDLRSNFENYLPRSSSTCFEPHWREKHDGVNSFVLALLVKTLSAKNNFQENSHFWISWFLEPKILTLAKIWGHIGESLFQELSNLFFGFLLAIIVPEIFGVFRSNVNFRKIWPLMTRSDLNIDLSEKNVEVVSKWILTSFRTLFSVFRYDE